MPFTFKDLHWARNIHVQQYLQPKSVGEALQMLLDYKGRARVIAGGTNSPGKYRNHAVHHGEKLILLIAPKIL